MFAQLLSMMAQSSEFGQMAIREEELPELDTLARDACHFDIKGGPENKHGKVNILLQVAPQLFTALKLKSVGVILAAHA